MKPYCAKHSTTHQNMPISKMQQELFAILMGQSVSLSYFKRTAGAGTGGGWKGSASFLHSRLVNSDEKSAVTDGRGTWRKCRQLN